MGPEPSARSSEGSPLSWSAQLPTHAPVVESRGAYADHTGRPARRSSQHRPGKAGGEQLDGRGRHQGPVGIHAPKQPAGLIGDRDAPLPEGPLGGCGRTMRSCGR